MESRKMVPMNLFVKVAQLCPTLCDPVDYTVHGILQAIILEWVAFPFCRGSAQPGEVLRQIFYRVGPRSSLGSPLRPVDKPKGVSWPAQ